MLASLLLLLENSASKDDNVFSILDVDYGCCAVSMYLFPPLCCRYLKHPIKLLYSVELTMVPSAVFTSLVPGSIGMIVSLLSSIPASFNIFLA
ncbi:hypothetical protein Tco_1561010 [Tanacetum coccineum]